MVLGISMVTYGDYYFTALGFCLVVLGTILASVKVSRIQPYSAQSLIRHGKTVMTNRLMTGTLKLPLLEILLRMCPLAALQSLAYGTMTGEVRQLIRDYNSPRSIPPKDMAAILLNGLLAFAQNLSSFQTNKVVGALTIAVCANVKQCMTILLAIAVFDVKVEMWNSLGMITALGGVCWYSWIELVNRGKTYSPQYRRSSTSQHQKALEAV